MTGKPSRGWDQDLQSLLIYNADPGESAYYETRSQMYGFLDAKGIERASGTPTTKGNALYYYRQALKFGDFKAAKKYREEYFKLSGSQRGMNISIKGAQPIAALPKKLRREFLRSLSPKDIKTYQAADKWYSDTYQKRRVNPQTKS
jgi:hypothetical protein